MAHTDYTAWIVLVIGIYAASASIGELRTPGMWLRMVDDLERSPAARFLTGIVCLAIGTPLYLAGSWASGDWMAFAVRLIGAWAVIEGALFLAVGEPFMAFSRRLMGTATRLWAWLSLLLGLAAIAAALTRF